MRARPAAVRAARPSRVALISSSFHPYQGGVEEHTRRVATALSRRGVAVEVWTVDRGERLGVRRVDGVTVRYLPTPLPARRFSALLGFGLRFPAAAVRWWRARRAFRPDVLHVQCFGPNGVYAYALHRLTRVPLVVSSHGETFADDHGVFDRTRAIPWAMGASLRRSSAVTGCSTFVLEDLARRFGADWDASTAAVVPNGVDPAERNAGSATVSHVAPVALAVGRLQHVKGFDLLIRAFARAVDRGDLPAGALLRIGGSGPEQPALEMLAADLGISDRVELLGALDRRQVAEEMARAAVVVVPSRAEAFGITVLEAWRAHAPVIATTRGGPPEFVEHGVTGVLVDPTDTAALAAAVARVLGDPDLGGAMGDAGWRRTLADFTWARVADRYLERYEACGLGAARRGAR